MTAAPTHCDNCGGPLADMGLRPADDGLGQIWLFRCESCMHDVRVPYAA